MHALYLRLEEHGFNETCGLEIGRLAGVDTLGLYGQIGQHCETFEDVVHLYDHYKALSGTPQTGVDLASKPDQFSIVVAVSNAREYVKSANFRLSFAYAQTVTIFRELLQDPSLHPSAIYFPSSSSEFIREYEAFFQAEIIFKSHTRAIFFSKELLNRPIPNALSATRAYLEELAAYKIQDRRNTHATNETLMQSIRPQLRKAILAHASDKEHVAQLMGMSSRTLHRRLKEHNLRFSELRQQVLIELAYEMLAEPQFSIEEIAYKLNYTEKSSFSRAFKQWTGYSPSEVRENLIP